MSKKDSKTYFVVTYRDPKEDKIVECKARTIHDSTLGLSFICIADFVFSNSMVVDPAEEHLRQKLENVKSLHLSIYSIISIVEVGMEHQGLKFQTDKSNLLVLNPGASPTPPPQV